MHDPDAIVSKPRPLEITTAMVDELQKSRRLDEFMQLTGLDSPSALGESDVYAARCVKCDTWCAVCKVVKVESHDDALESWCARCISIQLLRRVSWKQPVVPQVQMNPPPSPMSPWGTNR